MDITAKVIAADQRLTLTEILGFASNVPADAQIEPILRDVGTQRDPELVLHGLRASWNEGR